MYWPSLEEIKKSHFIFPLTSGGGFCKLDFASRPPGTIPHESVRATGLSQKSTFNCSQGGSRAGHEAIGIIIRGAQLVCPLSPPPHSINKKRITHRSVGVAGVTKRGGGSLMNCLYARGLKTLLILIIQLGSIVFTGHLI